MKSRSFRSGIISGVIGFFAACIWIIWVIFQSTNSTAAIGFIFMPVQALFVAFPCFIFGYFAHCALAAFRTPRRPWLGVLSAAVALALLLPFLSWFGNGLLLCKAVRDAHRMDLDETARFLETSPLKSNKYVLNAILERQDLNAESLFKIAQIPSPELHERMGSLFPVMGKNTKGLAVMRLVARHPNVDAKTLTWLSNSPDDYVLETVAGNSKTPLEVLRRLAQKGGMIEGGLAHNPNTPPELLHGLASSRDEYTRSSVAQNKATSSEDLEKLSKDPVWHVRRSVAMNPKCAPALKETLRNDPDARIRRYFK